MKEWNNFIVTAAKSGLDSKGIDLKQNLETFQRSESLSEVPQIPVFLNTENVHGV